jgi:MSHA biogenesis protein MshO
MRHRRPEAGSNGAPKGRQAGFTLVEMIVSIVLIGLLSMAAVPLLRLPLEGWMDATRRSTLTTEIEVIHAKFKDDMAHALPRSVRVRTAGTRTLMEFIEVKASGRYRTEAMSSGFPLCTANCGGTPLRNDALEPNCPETCFVNLSPWDNNTPPVLGANDWVMVNAHAPLINDPYQPALRTRAVAVAANGRVEMVAHSFPASPLSRFHITSGPVTYECNPVTRQLIRHWNYAFVVNQPANFPGASSAVLSERVQSCVGALSYQDAGVSTPPTSIYRGGIVNVLLRLGPSLREPQPTSLEEALLQDAFIVSEGP